VYTSPICLRHLVASGRTCAAGGPAPVVGVGGAASLQPQEARRPLLALAARRPYSRRRPGVRYWRWRRGVPTAAGGPAPVIGVGGAASLQPLHLVVYHQSTSHSRRWNETRRRL